MEEVSVQPNPNSTSTMEVEKPKKGIPTKTLLLILFLFIVAGGLIGFALYLRVNQKPPVVQKQAQITPEPIQTTLTISSIPTPLSTPSAYKTDVIINTGQNSVTSVQLELSYDPKVLTKVDITPGPFFVDPQVKLKSIDPINGRISFVVSVPTQLGVQNGILGQGIVAKINFSLIKGQGQTPTSIQFLPKSQVNAQDLSTSALKSTVDGTFTLLSFKPTLTPTPTATPSGQ